MRGYTAPVDPGRFGWGTHAFVALSCEGRMAAAEVREAVEHHPEVEAAYTVAGEASAMLHVRARDTAHLEEALERIRDHPGVTRTQTQIVLSTLFERPFEEPPGLSARQPGCATMWAMRRLLARSPSRRSRCGGRLLARGGERRRPAGGRARGAGDADTDRDAAGLDRARRDLRAPAGAARRGAAPRARAPPARAATARPSRYIAGRLRAAGFRVTEPAFKVPLFLERSPARVSGLRRSQFLTLTYSGSGRAAGTVRRVGLGCTRADYRGPARAATSPSRSAACARSRRGRVLAQRAGAGALLVVSDRGAPFAGSLQAPRLRIPVLAVSTRAGRELKGRVRVRVDAISARRTTHNVIGEIGPADAERVVMAGAHLDSVVAGPGLNDNGSGVAAVLEVAEQLASRPLADGAALRVGFWSAEEIGLVGSRRYVRGLSAAERRRIRAYVNLDMVGSPGAKADVYAGDGEAGPPDRGRAARGPARRGGRGAPRRRLRPRVVRRRGHPRRRDLHRARRLLPPGLRPDRERGRRARGGQNARATADALVAAGVRGELRLGGEGRARRCQRPPSVGDPVRHINPPLASEAGEPGGSLTSLPSAVDVQASGRPIRPAQRRRRRVASDGDHCVCGRSPTTPSSSMSTFSEKKQSMSRTGSASWAGSG